MKKKKKERKKQNAAAGWLAAAGRCVLTALFGLSQPFPGISQSCESDAEGQGVGGGGGGRKGETGKNLKRKTTKKKSIAKRLEGLRRHQGCARSMPPCAGAQQWVKVQGCSRGCWQRVGAAGLLSSASAPVFLAKTCGHAGQGCHRGWCLSPGLRSQPFAGAGMAVAGSISVGPAGRERAPPVADSEQSSSPRTGIGSDQEDSKPITLDSTDFQESFVTSGVFSVTELIQVSRTPVVTGTGPNFSLGELQGHLAYDLNPSSTGMRRTLPSTSSSGSKRHKSGSMEDDIDTSPGGEYYTSSNSPTSSSRNWTEDMEGGISPTVKKTEMDKSPFNSPSPQDSSPRLSSFTQHHRPVIAVHSGIARSPHPSSTLHFPTTSILPQTASTYFPHTAIRYPPHLNPQDPLKDLVSLACDPSNQQPGPLNGSGQVKVPSHYLPTQMLAPPPPPGMPRLAVSPDTKSTTTTSEGGTTSPTSPTYSAPGTPPANRSFVGLGPRDPGSIYQAQSWYLG
uniref:Nuclear factor I C n=1 Tax=Anas platyrhynchos platyrhynchos TaxID=8840 RepID=A0A493TTR1_ANAPP